MVELVDTLDLGSSAERCASSTLALGTRFREAIADDEVPGSLKPFENGFYGLPP